MNDFIKFLANNPMIPIQGVAFGALLVAFWPRGLWKHWRCKFFGCKRTLGVGPIEKSGVSSLYQRTFTVECGRCKQGRTETRLGLGPYDHILHTFEGEYLP